MLQKMVDGSEQKLTVTLITPSLSVLVVTSHAMIPAAKPHTAPKTQPHLFARALVMQSEIGTTAPPRMTPMNV
jgi:hypothetical protein